MILECLRFSLHTFKMNNLLVNVYMFLAVLLLCSVSDSVKKQENVKDNNSRTGKIFSLFNVVTWNNGPCRSNIALSGGTTNTRRNGTCLTSSQCSSKGGTGSGNCAAGFGICCVFLVSGSGTSNTITQNCTYVQNPGFPSSYAGTSAVSYKVNKCGPSVCCLRLDFESFTIAGTPDSLETNGGVCQDTFTVTASPTTSATPTICGQNTGQHIYIDMGNLGSDMTTLNFAFASALSATSSANRQWDIKVTQIPCNANYRPPPGCLQYDTALSGTITTFNYLPATGQSNLANQKYAICIRPQEGYCCIQYQACNPDPTAMTLSPGNLANAGVDDMCESLDYIGIPESAGSCSQGASGTLIRSKYCGPFLSADTTSTVNAPICDCTEPFTVEIVTNNQPDNCVTVAGVVSCTNNMVASRGACLTYMQIACSN